MGKLTVRDLLSKLDTIIENNSNYKTIEEVALYELSFKLISSLDYIRWPKNKGVWREFILNYPVEDFDEIDFKNYLIELDNNLNNGTKNISDICSSIVEISRICGQIELVSRD